MKSKIAKKPSASKAPPRPEKPKAEDDFQRFLDEVAAKAGPPRWVDEAGNEWYCSRAWADKEGAADDDERAGRRGPLQDDVAKLFEPEEPRKPRQ